MGNCCDKCIWEIRKFFVVYSTDYEALEYDTIQRTVKYQSNYESIERRRNIFDSMRISRDLSLQAPFDVIGHILEYVSDPEVFMKVVHTSKTFAEYIETEYDRCGRFVMFSLARSKRISRRPKPLTYVHQLKILYGSNFVDNNFRLFPNVVNLVIWKGEDLNGSGLRHLNKLHALRLWQCKMSGRNITQFSNQLHTLEISDTPNITEEDISKFQRLHNLSIKKVYHFDDWNKICECHFFTTTLQRLEIRECRIGAKFRIPKQLKTLKIASCRNFSDKELLTLLEECNGDVVLEALSISNCQKVRGTCFNQFKSLRKLSIQWIDHISNGPDVFDIDCLEELKIQGCVGITNEAIMNLTNLKKLTLIEEQQITDEAFRDLGEIDQLKIVQCVNITDGILKFVRKSLKRLRVQGCENFRNEVLEEVEIGGVRII